METGLLVHKHLIVRAEAMNPPKSEEKSIQWLTDFISFIKMKPLVGPFAKYLDMPGNRGLTVAAIIETSHIVVHVWDEPIPALMQIDIYSCGEFDAKQVCNKLMDDFDIRKIEYKYLNRETGLIDL